MVGDLRSETKDSRFGSAVCRRELSALIRGQYQNACQTGGISREELKR